MSANFAYPLRGEQGVTPLWQDGQVPPDPTKPQDFKEWHTAKTRWIDEDNQNEEWHRLRKWGEIHKFYEGQQLIWWNGDLQNGYWKPADLEDGDPYYAINIFAGYINGLIAELYRANPQLSVSAKTDQWQQVEGAIAAKAVLVNEEQRIWTDETVLRSLWFFVLYGNVLWHTAWVPTGGPTVEIPQYTNKTSMVDTRIAVCPMCGIQQDASNWGQNIAGAGQSAPTMPNISEQAMAQPAFNQEMTSVNMGQPVDSMFSSPDTGMGGQMPVPASNVQQTPVPPCPDCGSQMVVMGGSVQNLNVPQFQLPKKQDGGNVRLSIPDPTQIKLQINARSLDESAYLRIDYWVLEDEANMLYGKKNWKHGDSRSNDPKRTLIREHEVSPGNVTGMGAFGSHEMSQMGMSGDKKIVLITAYWMRPCLYWDLILDKDLTVENRAKGKLSIPGGTNMRDYCKSGMYMVKNGDEILDLDDRGIDDHWVMARYEAMPTKIWGNSAADNLIQGQREYNELRSVRLENAFHNATPATIVNPKKFKPGTLASKARQVIPFENYQKGDVISDHFFQPGSRTLGPELPAMQQEIKGDLQFICSAPVGESGISGASASTATGMQIVKDWTNSRLSIHVGPYTSARVKRAKQHLTLNQKHWVGARYVKIMNETTMDDGRWFTSADIQGDYDITTKPGSTQIRSALEMKDNILQMLVAGGVPFGIFNPAFPKQASQTLTRELGLPMDLDGYTRHARKQRKEIEKLKEVASVEAQYGLMPGQLALAEVPIEETDDDAAHIEMIEYYMNTDLGMQEPREVKAAILEHMHGHEMAMVMKQQKKMMLAMSADPMAGQMPGNNPMQPGAKPQPPNKPAN